MEKIKTEININEFPPQLHGYMTGAEIYDSSCGENSRVLYSNKGYYIKIAPKGSLEREAAVAQKLAEKSLCAKVAEYISTDKDYMVTYPAIGQDATHFLAEPEKLCIALAEGMKYLHSLPVDGVPSSPQMDFYNKDNDLNYDTFIHGDFCLPNIMLENYGFKMFIDMGLAGSGDRHIDVFWVLWSLWFNLKTDKYTDYFLDLYGRDKISLALVHKIAIMEGKL